MELRRTRFIVSNILGFDLPPNGMFGLNGLHYAARATLTTFLIATLLMTKPGLSLRNGHDLPALGWNSWVNYGCNVSEALIKAQAIALQAHGLDRLGYRYLNIDDCWQAPARDPTTGQLRADPVRFPSGIDGLAAWLHARQLKLGIYSDVGTQTCQGRPGSFDHYDLDARTFVKWGVDYLKLDTCHLTAAEKSNPQPFYANMSAALLRAATDAGHRDTILYSICNWGKHDPWEWAPDIANSWRTTQDLYPNWNRVVTILDATAPLAKYAGPGAHNDPDMLEVGIDGTFFNWKHMPLKCNLTQREASSHFSLWSLLGAPLVLGMDLTQVNATSPWALELVSNAELLAVNQDALAAQATRVHSSKSGTWVGGVCVGVPQHCAHIEIWRKNLTGGRFAVALFNRADPYTQFASQFSDERIEADWATLGIANVSARFAVRDLLVHTTNGTASGLVSATVPPHGAAVVLLEPTS